MSMASRLVNICGTTIKESLFAENEYDSETNTIGLNSLNDTLVGRWVKRGTRRPASTNYSLYHELGHAVFDFCNIKNNSLAIKLFGSFRKKYNGRRMLLDSVLDEVSDGYITAYAQQHPEEDFADCFAFILVEKNRIPKSIKNRKLKDKLVFVKKIICSMLQEG